MAGPLEEFTIQEMALPLREMKNKKSPGPTGLTSNMMKLTAIVDLLDFLKSLRKSGTLVKTPPTRAKMKLIFLRRKRRSRLNVSPTEASDYWNTRLKFSKKH